MEMINTRTLFYRPKLFDGHVTDNAIDFHTRLWNILLNPAHMKESFLERWRIIKLLTCSHCEKWLPDENGLFEKSVVILAGINSSYEGSTTVRNPECSRNIYLGECFTSTMGQTGGKNRTGDGTIIRPASEILSKHPERFFFSEMEVSIDALEHGKIWARGMVKNNLGYDRGDIRKLFNLNENKRVQYIYDFMLICSGACWAFDCIVAEHWVSLPEFENSILHKLWKGRTINMLPSPLLYALWQYMAGVKFYDLKTGKLLL